MIKASDFYLALQRLGLNFFAGVPDSLLKDFCAYLSDNCAPQDHVICANEGNAIAMAAGVYLATGKPGLVYMQNSGLGNASNPLLSLADKEVYAIPMLLMIGWRGEPGRKDEPQHVKQGRVQTALLDAMEIPYIVLDANVQDYASVLTNAYQLTIETGNPVALVVRKGTFEAYKSRQKSSCPTFEMTREAALELILQKCGDYHIVSTTGKTSRELYELRIKRGEQPCDFLTVGSMGHSSSIAAGIALKGPDKLVICIDGDGAMLMHLGAMVVIGKLAPRNFIHILINNYCHESVGGQATAGDSIDFANLAQAIGYKHFLQAKSKAELTTALDGLSAMKCPILLEVIVQPGSRADLGRPQSSPAENCRAFMAKLDGDRRCSTNQPQH
jgi:phosphonopyruvate decarboxylase